MLQFSCSNLPTPTKSPAASKDLAFKGTFSFFARGDVMKPTISGGIPVTVFIKPVRVSSLEFTSQKSELDRTGGLGRSTVKPLFHCVSFDNFYTKSTIRPKSRDPMKPNNRAAPAAPTCGN